MSKYNSYYPGRIGDQILWWTNFILKLGGYQATLGYAAADIAAVLADANRIFYLLNTVQPAAQSFAQTITDHINLVENGGSNAIVDLPTFVLPTTPPPPPNVLPGALKRVFAFITNLKTRPGYNSDIGTALQILSSTVADDPAAIPAVIVTPNSGEVVLAFKKIGHPGVLIQEQTGAGSVWNTLAISTSSPYHDVRPLAAAGQPEKRRYRFCYWDNVPTNVWTPVYEVTFGG
jgi:hypothetical protein